MPSKPSDNDLCQAVLDFVVDGRFPESENIVSSEFSAAAASKGLDIICTARAEVEVRVERIPRCIQYYANWPMLSRVRYLFLVAKLLRI